MLLFLMRDGRQLRVFPAWETGGLWGMAVASSPAERQDEFHALVDLINPLEMPSGVPAGRRGASFVVPLALDHAGIAAVLAVRGRDRVVASRTVVQTGTQSVARLALHWSNAYRVRGRGGLSGD